MCGIVGLWQHSAETPRDALRAIATRMADTLTHRGPDDAGTWEDPDAGLALGFRRLAIIDLSPAGHQPMVSATGRYAMVFNGEVYNYAALRAEMEATGCAPSTFSGHSDTEVMLAAIEAWGLRKAIGQFIGMFAFALWDRKERTLHLVRDRLGIKPLYYGRAGDTLVFGSELKALRAHPDFKATVSREALALFLRYAYVPAPYAIYEGVRKLPPGTIATLTSDTEELSLSPYWSLSDIVACGQSNGFAGTEAEAVAAMDTLARDAVALRMMADVPLGAFLSGGLDSSLVVALMQAQSSRPVQTFAIGFTEERWNEAPFARAVAVHLGTDHHELIATPEQAMEVIPRLPEFYDEPFADVSQVPTLLVSELARTRVTVSLSGDGGDELFGGYYAYTLGEQIRGLRRRLPGGMATVAVKALTAFPTDVLLAGSGGSSRRLSADRLRKLADALPLAASPETLHRHLMSHWKAPTSVVRGAMVESRTAFDEMLPEGLNGTARAMYLDGVTYLPDDILTKVDRASMAVALEARVPLIDHRLVEFAWSLPYAFKRDGGVAKRILRKTLDRYVPPALFDRPKKGFGVPVDDWLRGPLRDWAEDLLSEQRLRREGYLEAQPIRARWEEHLSGRRNWPTLLWTVLMFQQWRERWDG
jgi:asparagine synthase (glutamine-hydrolysing)